MSKPRTHRAKSKPKAGVPAAPKKRDGRRKDYDDDELVMELARGASSAVDIARRIGLSPFTVCAIRSGRLRPELGPQIRQARERLERQLLTRVRRAMVARVGRLLRKALSSRRARAARETLLDLVLGYQSWRYHHER